MKSEDLCVRSLLIRIEGLFFCFDFMKSEDVCVHTQKEALKRRKNKTRRTQYKEPFKIQKRPIFKIQKRPIFKILQSQL